MTPDDVWVLCLRSLVIVEKKDEIALAYLTQMIDRVFSKVRRSYHFQLTFYYLFSDNSSCTSFGIC